MQAQKVQIKLFSNGAPDVEGHVPVFHRWIRDNVLGELIIDVVDYSHVASGPEVVMIGHGSDYALDRGQGRIGLLYSNKREAASDDGPFVAALRRSLRAAALLERETEPKTPFAFRTDELLVRIADRLNAPNNDETFRALEPALRAALTRIYGDTPFELSRTGDARELFSVQVSVPGSKATVSELSARLS